MLKMLEVNGLCNFVSWSASLQSVFQYQVHRSLYVFCCWIFNLPRLVETYWEPSSTSSMYNHVLSYTQLLLVINCSISFSYDRQSLTSVFFFLKTCIFFLWKCIILFILIWTLKCLHFFVEAHQFVLGNKSRHNRVCYVILSCRETLPSM